MTEFKMQQVPNSKNLMIYKKKTKKIFPELSRNLMITLNHLNKTN